MATEAPQGADQNRERPAIIFIHRAEEPGDAIEMWSECFDVDVWYVRALGNDRATATGFIRDHPSAKAIWVAAGDILLKSKEALKTRLQEYVLDGGTLLLGFPIQNEKKQDVFKTWMKDGFDLSWEFGAYEKAEVAWNNPELPPEQRPWLHRLQESYTAKQTFLRGVAERHS
ncbi:hypothetical protein DL767_000104 [Monosporascus sp. MG133]|nr:hypothetical protein DL767_000104 [Monosporascus sp. MG133]